MSEKKYCPYLHPDCVMGCMKERGRLAMDIYMCQFPKADQDEIRKLPPVEE